MGRVVTIASAKGGVGKTTTTANVGAALAAAGKRVVAVDADLGMPNLGGSFGVDAKPTVHDVLAGEVAVEAAVHEGDGDVDVVPGSDALADFRTADPTGLDGVLSTLAETYEYVLVDAGAGLSHDSLVPLSVADEVILVAGAGRDARADAEKTRKLADRLGTPIRGVVFTRLPADASDAEVRGDSELNDLDALAFVYEDPSVAEATETGRPIATVSPDHPAAVAYRQLATALTDEADAVVEASATDTETELNTELVDSEDDNGVGTDPPHDEKRGAPERGDETGAPQDDAEEDPDIDEDRDEGSDIDEREADNGDEADRDDVDRMTGGEDEGSNDDVDESAVDESDDGDAETETLVDEAETSDGERTDWAITEDTETDDDGDEQAVREDTETDATSDDGEPADDADETDGDVRHTELSVEDSETEEEPKKKKKGLLSRLFG